MQNNKFVLIPQTFNFSALQPQLSLQQTNNHYFGHYKKYINKTNDIIKNNKCVQKILSLIKDDHNVFFTIIIKHPVFFGLSVKQLNVVSQAYFHELFFGYLISSTDSYVSLKNHKLDIFKSESLYDSFYKEYLTKSLDHFASGWIWFVYNSETSNIDIYDEQDAKYPHCMLNNVIMCIDLWEHAYYTDYTYDREKYVKNIFMLIDWNKIYEKIKT